MAQMQISVDFKIIDPKITEEMVITGAFGKSGTNKYAMTLKASGVESFSCIIKISESVIIQPSTGRIQEQTHKKHLVTGTIKPKKLIEDIVLKQSISQPLFAQSHVLSKETMKDALNFKPPRKLYECTTCTDNATPWVLHKEENCEKTGLVPKCFHQSNVWKRFFLVN